MNRIDRLSAILILLQTRKLVTAQEIAERFGISIRTVYRDMKSLDEAGVPIGAEAGKGYYLVDGYHLPPVMFTQEEAGALMIAGKLVDGFSDHSAKQYYSLALDKIKSVLPERQLNQIEQLGKQVHVLHKSFQTIQGGENKYLIKVQQALSGNLCMEIGYFSNSKKEGTIRVVEPYALCFYSYQWHLIAYCRLRRDFRDFRLDRIQHIQIQTETYEQVKDFSLENYFDSLWKAEGLYNVTIRFERKEAPSVLNSKYYFGFYDETIEGNYVDMKFAVNEYDYIATWLIGLGDIVIQIKEPELNNLVKEKIANLAFKYSIGDS